MQLHLEKTEIEFALDSNELDVIGLFAKATLRISHDSHPEGFVERFTITTPGIWGLVGYEYNDPELQEYGQEEKETLKEMLKALGIGAEI